jgi:[ribosomal protein S5]-alanine N-acetyltransferase
VSVETARLRLTPATGADVDPLHAIWMDPDVRRYLWDDIVIGRDIAIAVLEHSAKDWRERRYGLWLIAEDHETAGFVGLRSSEERPEPELVFGLLPAYWHRGYATEAAEAALRYLFETLRYPAAWAATDPANAASIQVLERIGMTLESRAELLTYRIERAATSAS